jgi:hypothetical protein
VIERYREVSEWMKDVYNPKRGREVEGDGIQYDIFDTLQEPL